MYICNKLNTTIQLTGWLYLCDMNEGDHLDYLWQNPPENENVTYTIVETESSPQFSLQNDKDFALCIERNSR